MTVLFVENGDSFSWNVVESLPWDRAQVAVLSASEAAERLVGVEAVVVGPGPTDPLRAGLVELVRRVLARGVPFLGVCLGHQALGMALGARLVRSPPVHGHQAEVELRGSRWLPEGRLTVMRYHSLSLTDVPPPLRVVARLQDGTVMAVEHEALPAVGLQFHPDSYGTPQGVALLEAFFSRVMGGARRWSRPREPSPPRPAPLTRGPAEEHAASEPLRLSTLERSEAFVLLGPGYSADGRWRLLEGAHVASRGPVVVCRAEDRTGTWLAGTLRPVAVEVDVEPATAPVAVEVSTYPRDVERIRERIAAGDVYQVNLTTRATVGPVPGEQLLAAMVRRGVPRHAAWLRVPGVGELVTASPELLFEVVDERLRAEPMKGTAPPHQRAVLEASEKDRAELAMITDLLRNDLQQLCVPGTVEVETARRLIELPYVVQAVSDVVGTLRRGVGLPEVLAVLHPGGSVTGTPRPAALEVISLLEPGPRGFFCGALGLTEGLRTRCALLIRTATRTAGGWTYGVGAGITYQSDPAAEAREVELKLGALGLPVIRS